MSTSLPIRRWPSPVYSKRKLWQERKTNTAAANTTTTCTECPGFRKHCRGGGTKVPNSQVFCSQQTVNATDVKQQPISNQELRSRNTMLRQSRRNRRARGRPKDKRAVNIHRHTHAHHEDAEATRLPFGRRATSKGKYMECTDNNNNERTQAQRANNKEGSSLNHFARNCAGSRASSVSSQLTSSPAHSSQLTAYSSQFTVRGGGS